MLFLLSTNYLRLVWQSKLVQRQQVWQSAISNLIDKAIQETNNLLRLRDDINDLQTEIEHLHMFVTDVSNHLRGRERCNIPNSVQDWLNKMEENLQSAESIVNGYINDNGGGCCCNCLSRRKLSEKIRRWKNKTERLLQQANRQIRFLYDLRKDDEFHSMKEEIVSTLHEVGNMHDNSAIDKILIQPLPDSGLMGEQIERKGSQIQRWLIHDDTVRIIAVVGMGGVGKTSLLKKINNSKQVQTAFELVIWITVSQNRSVKDLQSSMAQRIGLHRLSESSSEDERAMALNTFLLKKRFLLILDDIWSNIQLGSLGVSSAYNGSGAQWKVVLSTRNEQVTRSMKADHTIKMTPLSKDESWELFRKGAFLNDIVPQQIQNIAMAVADECKGLPLALNVISTAMAKQNDRNEWIIALNQLRTVDKAIYSVHNDTDRDLFQRLKWSYNALSHGLKLCFLYCAFFPEDKRLHTDELIRMWRAEGLVQTKDLGNWTHITGHSFLKVLVDRCLLEAEFKNSLTGKIESCKMHDLIRDLAIHVGEEEENCFFRAGQKMKSFPADIPVDCTRLSLMSNDIERLPEIFIHPTLCSLLLAWNIHLKEVPESFLQNLTALKLLDLSRTAIKTLPKSMGQLKHLVCLGLRKTAINKLPEVICELNRLEFIDLSSCFELQYLPSRIGELKCLKHLDLSGCFQLRFIPRGMSQLTSMESLYVSDSRAVAEQLGLHEGLIQRAGLKEREAACVKDLCSLKTLSTLQIEVQGSIPVGVMGNWAEMRELSLCFKDEIAQDMQAMERLEILSFEAPDVMKLPQWIAGFQNLMFLEMHRCEKLHEIWGLERLPRLKQLHILKCRELKELGVGFGRGGGFPELEELEVLELPSVESLAGPLNSTEGMMEKGALPRLKRLNVFGCPNLRTLPLGLHKLSQLEVLNAREEWWTAIVWEEGEDWQLMRIHLQINLSLLR
eukprot:Gb_29143 [translate_table: standard]